MTGAVVTAENVSAFPAIIESARCHHQAEQIIERPLTREAWRTCTFCDTDKMATYFDLLIGRAVALV